MSILKVVKSGEDSKEVSLIRDIELILADRYHAFLAQYFDYPTAFLLGPKEYLSLSAAIQKAMDMNSGFVPVQSFMGIPVYPKQGPGIDLLIPVSRVTQFALGVSNTPKGGPRVG